MKSEEGNAGEDGDGDDDIMTPSVIALGRWMPSVIKIEGREQGLGTNQHHREMHFNKSKSKH